MTVSAPVAYELLRAALDRASRCGAAPLECRVRRVRRTVEYHLTHAFRKLGVSSRDELAAAVGRELAAR